MLLLLDNLDQVTSAAPLVADLLAAAPHLIFLVTSREPLHIPGEQEFPVPPLVLPDPRNLPPVERLLDFSAIALFVHRARAVRPDFSLTSDSAPAAIRVCRGARWLAPGHRACCGPRQDPLGRTDCSPPDRLS